MGLVKFNQTTLNVEGVPDGSVIVTGQEATDMVRIRNEHALIQSYLPVGITAGPQLGALIEKGQKYDPLAQKLTDAETAKTAAEAKLAKFSDVPQDYSKNEWERLKGNEQRAIRDGKRKAVTDKVMATLERATGQKIVIDERFIDQQKLATFDFDAQNAEELWAAVLNDAHTAQENLIKQVTHGIPAGPTSTQPITPEPAPVTHGMSSGGKVGDVVGDNGIIVNTL